MKTDNSHPEIDRLIEEFADGVISHEDALLLRQWTDESQSNADYARRRLQILASVSVSNDAESFDTDAAIGRFRSHSRRLSVPMWIRVASAAAVVLLIALPLAFFHIGRSNVQDQFAEVRLEAPDGSQLSLTLPDGTKVNLNSGSAITYSQGYGITERSVSLRGEAYFTVAHNDKLPFSVKTKELTVNDIGTEFCFSNYDSDSTAFVDLYDGKVSLDNNLTHETGYTLKPGEGVVIDKATGAMEKKAASALEPGVGKFDNIVFDNTSIANAAKVLSRAYGRTITASGNVAGKRIYGSFNRKTETLDDILKSMSETGRLHYKTTKEKYVLY